MLLHTGLAQQAAHHCIMSPNGSTTGKCQSQVFGTCNPREAKLEASVSPLFLTQHITKGSCTTSQDLQWSVTQNAVGKRWGGELDMNTGKLASGSFGETALLYVVSYLKSHPSAASVGLC